MKLQERIHEQFPSLYITLVSVLIGLFFADLVGEARARMHLFPLDLFALRNWGQIAGMGGAAFAIWTAFAHTGITRRRIPLLSDSLVVFVTPVPLLIGNSYVGRPEAWSWFLFAAGYLALGVLTGIWQVRLARLEPDLAGFARFNRLTGYLAVMLFGVPFYAVVGWADRAGLLPLWLEALLAWTAGPAGLFCSWLFMRDWHRILAEAQV